MDDLGLILLATGAIGIVLVAPLAAFILALGARTRARNAEAALRAVEARLAYLEWWAGSASRRDVPAAVPGPAAEAAPAMAPAPAAQAAPAPPDSPPAPSSSTTPEPAPRAPPAPPALRRGIDLEGLVGVRLFAWLGGAVLFVAAALFLQYSIEHDLLPPAARVAVGLLAGTLFLVGGDALRRRADRAGQALSGAGLGTLYASLYAARALYDLLPAPATFAGMALVTLVAGVLAVRRGTYVLAVIGLLGGFATPILLSTGDNRPVVLFAYIAMLDAAVVVLSYYRRWHSLLLLSALGSVLLYGGWALQFLGETTSAISLAGAALLGAMFVLPALFGPSRLVGPSGAPSIPSTGGADGAESRLSTLARRAAVAFGVVAPFLVALAVAGTTRLEVSPVLLVAYLALLSLGTAVVSSRAGLEWLAVVSPLLSLLALFSRIDDDLFPEQGAATLVLFALPAAFALAESLVVEWRRSSSNHLRALRMAAGVALSSAPILVARIAAIEPIDEPIGGLALFTGLHLVGLIVLVAGPTAPLRETPSRHAGWLFAANAVSVGALFALSPRHDAARTIEFVAITSVFMLLLLLAGIAFGRQRGERLAWLAAGVALLGHFPLVYLFARETWSPAALAAYALGFALLAVATLRSYLRSLRDHPERAKIGSGTVAVLGAIALAFVTASVPLALQNQWITVAWAAEAAALAWFWTRAPHDGLVVGTALLAGATFIRLVANPWLWEYEPTGGIVVINWLLYAFGIPIVSFFAAAHWLRASALATKVHLRGALAIAAGVLAFLLMNAEIADAFAGTIRGGLRWSGESVLEDMIYSLGWGLFALTTLVIGIIRRSRGARAAALGVLVLTFAKVFLHDLWQLGSLYRVGSMIGLAVALLAVSFLLQRFVLRIAPTEGSTQ